METQNRFELKRELFYSGTGSLRKLMDLHLGKTSPYTHLTPLEHAQYSLRASNIGHQVAINKNAYSITTYCGCVCIKFR